MFYHDSAHMREVLFYPATASKNRRRKTIQVPWGVFFKKKSDILQGKEWGFVCTYVRISADHFFLEILLFFSNSESEEFASCFGKIKQRITLFDFKYSINILTLRKMYMCSILIFFSHFRTILTTMFSFILFPSVQIFPARQHEK